MIREARRPVAIITGAAQRIGAAIATQLHQVGFRVVVHYHHSHDAATQLVAAFNRTCSETAWAVQGDLCLPRTPALLLAETLTQFGQVDVLVNNASIFSRHDADWDSMWRCNVHAPYQLSRAAFSALADTQGSIINITDIHASMPLRDYAAYCQTKAALAMQTRALAQEFAPNVRVNAIAPGAIAWPEGDNQISQVVQEKILAKILLKRHGVPDNIAQAVLYLVNNSYVTGQSLQVDGGRYLT